MKLISQAQTNKHKRKWQTISDIPEEATSEDHTRPLTTIYIFLVQEAAGIIIDSGTKKKPNLQINVEF